MAEIAFTQRQKHGAIIITWEGMATDDTLVPYEPPSGFDLESVHVLGDFGGSNFMMTGANDGGTTFSDILASSVNADGIAAPKAQAEQYSAKLTGGVAGAADVHAIFRSRG